MREGVKVKKIKSVLALEVLTKMGYIKDYESSDIKDIIQFANSRHGVSMCRVVDKGEIVFSGKTSNLVSNFPKGK